MTARAALPRLTASGIFYLGLHGVSSRPGLRNNLAPLALRAVLSVARERGWAMSLRDPNPRKLILTFDDGRAFDGELTDILDEYEATGIFLACTDDSFDPTFASAPAYLAFTADNRRYLLERHFIGSHTRAHSKLRGMAEREQRVVLTESFARFGDTFGFRPWCFAYPWGLYDGATLRLLDELGIHYAFLAAPGTRPRRHPFLLPRLFLDLPGNDALGFEALLAGFDRPLPNLKLAIRQLHARFACPGQRAE